MLHILALSAVLTATPVADNAAHAFWTGYDLVRFCKSTKQEERRECLGYVKGVADLFAYLQQIQKHPPCLHGQTPEDLIASTLHMLKARPGDLELGAQAEVMTILAQSCEENDFDPEP